MDYSLDISERINAQIVLKRGIDILGAILLLVLFSPLILIISLLISLDSHSTILYRQVRIGKMGRRFEMLKFRTMRVEVDDWFEKYLDQNPATRMEYARYQKLASDPRLTPLGKFLRRSSLDEIPQLWNVLRGEMSLVGPRPFLPEQLEMYGQGLTLYFRVKPGITGLWQVSGRNHTSFARRTELDVHYVMNWSIWLDIYILTRTVWVVLRQDGAC